MAARVLISLEDISLTFGGKPLFEELRMHIAEGDKICLVGKNGAGKTTLMRLILGELELDRGTRFALPGLRLGYLAQQVPFVPSETVRQFVLSGLRAEELNEAKHYLADIVMAPLTLDPEATMGTLSGGQLRRAALARALVAEPDLLLLDEPTNHLDITAIEWLENFLAAYAGAVLCVSHDRAFLANISRKVYWIDRGQIRVCPKGYAAFDDWAEQIVEQEARELQNMQKKLAAEIDWTQGGVSGRRKRNQRRLNELNRLREKLKADKAAYRARMQTIEVDALAPLLASKRVVEFKQVSKSFTRDGRTTPILKEFNLRILRGDRIGLLGKNGSGKSTFLRLLVGDLEPDGGRITRGKTISISYFDQNRSMLSPQKSLWETLCPQGGDRVLLSHGEEERSLHVCAYLKRYLFDPKQANDKVATLSGGQQNRLMLAKILANPGSLLILDEPTNDLDMDTLDMLEDILAEYTGTLIVVSHDRDFLDRTVTQVLAFEGDGNIEGYMGGYTDYLNAIRKKPTSAPHENKKIAIAKTGAEAPTAKSAPLSYKYKRELEQLPAKIAAMEEELATLRQQLADPRLYTADPSAFDRATRRYGEAQRTLEQAETRWLELEEQQQNTSTSTA